jgi:hypothetical protein
MVRGWRTLAIAGTTALAAMCGPSFAGEEPPPDPDHASEPPRASLGLNVFGLSLHTDRSEGHNELNPGLGLRYTFWEPAPRWTMFGEASFYYDSERHWAKYVGVGMAYRFADAWFAGAAVTYGQSESYNDGKPFFALLPGIGYEWRGIVFNAVLLPEDRGSGVAGVAVYMTVPLQGLH